MSYKISIIEPVYKFLGYIFSITECRKISWYKTCFHEIINNFEENTIMKRLFIILIAALAIISFSAADNAYAVSYEFGLGSDELNLNHNFAYTWGLSEETEEKEIITGATLTFTNINNWVADEPDTLYVHLLDSAPDGIRSYNDSRSEGDYFGSSGILLFTFTDDNESELRNKKGKLTGYDNPAENLIYDFTSNPTAFEALKSYMENGILAFGFGFDPDCHYNFSEIKFTLLTELVTPDPVIDPDPSTPDDPQPIDPPGPASIPEPGTLVLLGSGIVALAFFRKCNFKK
jgi:hypothetical protein